MMQVFATGVSGAKGQIATLTDRELEVYRAIGHGKSSREIAGDMGISVRTVDAHRTHIKVKMGFRDAADVAYHAIRWVESQS